MKNVEQCNIREEYERLKIEAIEELQDYNLLKRDMYNLQLKIKVIEDRCYSGQVIGYSEKIQTSGNGYENSITQMIDNKSKIENQLSEKRVRLNIIDTALSYMSDEYRELVELRYIKNYSMNKLTDKYFLDRSSVYRKIQKALAQYIYCKNGVYIQKYKNACRDIEFKI